MREGEWRSKDKALRLRKEMTSAEIKLWAFLRGRRMNGFKFRRQHPIGDYIADFACLSEKLIIEVDGATHATQKEQEHDAQDSLFTARRLARHARDEHGCVQEFGWGVAGD